jgi:ATP-dependent 26S proteasome regulatory subunit
MSEQGTTFLGEEKPVETDNPLTELVGDGKKYKTVEELAKAYKNADQFIETLKTEKRTVEEQYHDALSKSRSVEEILTALNETKTTIVEKPTQTQDPVDVHGEVVKVLAERETAAKKKATADSTWDKLAKLYGDLDKAKVAVTEYVGGDPVKAKLVETLGSTNPDEMVKFMSSMKKPIETFTDDGSGSDADPNGIPAALTWKLAKDVKKNNPRLYNSMKFQQALHTAAAGNPDFYK